MKGEIEMYHKGKLSQGKKKKYKKKRIKTLTLRLEAGEIRHEKLEFSLYEF